MRQLTTSQPSARVRNHDGSDTLRILVWYPSSVTGGLASLDLGPPGAPLFKVGSVARGGAFHDATPRPVIMLSHGFGGSAQMMGWFAIAMAQRGYVVIGVDHPGNNGADQLTLPGATLFWERAEDLKTALAAVKANPTIGSHIDTNRVGVAGYSIGGFTALLAAGGRAAPELGVPHCSAHPDEGSCKPQPEFPATLASAVEALRGPELAPHASSAGADHTLHNVKAAFAMAPVAAIIEPESLKRVRIPVSIVVGDSDEVVPAETHAGIAANLIPDATYTVTRGVTHYSYLAECTDAGRMMVELCKRATEQQAAHQQAIASAAALFDKALK